MAGGTQPTIMELVQNALDSTGLKLKLDTFKKVEGKGVHVHIFEVDDAGSLVAEWFDGYLIEGGQPLQGDYGCISPMPAEHRRTLYQTLLAILHL